MNLLLVGGSGFVGRNLTEKLDLDRLGVRELAATYRRDGSFPAVVAARGDRRLAPLRYDLLADEPDLSRFDVAIYLAGNADHGLALRQPDDDLTRNALAMTRFLARFRGRLIYFSTGAVYFGLRGPVSPRAKVAPAFPYAISKLASELYVKTARQDGRLSGATVVRFYYAFGPHEKPRRLVPRLVDRFVRERRRDFAINGDGQTLMQPMYVDDLVQALEALLRVDADGETLDLCGRPLTLLDLVRRVAAACGVEPEISHRPTDERPLAFHSSGAAFARKTGWRPTITIEEGVRRYRSWLEAAA